MGKKALIFDFDGVLVNSEEYWPETNVRIMAHLLSGRPWTAEDNRKITGHSARNVHEILTTHYDLRLDFDSFERTVWEFASNMYEELVMPMPGVIDCMKRTSATGVPLAIASSNERRMIHIVMKRLELDSFFKTVKTKDDVEKTKPFPDVYLRAAEALELRPERCVAIEDSPTGIKAAKAAGMHCIALHSDHNGEHDLSQADTHISHFDELTDERLASLLG